MIHDLKIWPCFFQPIIDDIKRFEIRKNDRGFSVGDVLHLREWDKATGYTGRETYQHVEYLISECSGLAPGYVIMGINGPWGRSVADS